MLLQLFHKTRSTAYMLHWPWNHSWRNWQPQPGFPEVGSRLWAVCASTSHFNRILYNGLPGSMVKMIWIMFQSAHSLFMPCCILLQQLELWAWSGLLGIPNGMLLWQCSLQHQKSTVPLPKHQQICYVACTVNPHHPPIQFGWETMPSTTCISWLEFDTAFMYVFCLSTNP